MPNTQTPQERGTQLIADRKWSKLEDLVAKTTYGQLPQQHIVKWFTDMVAAAQSGSTGGHLWSHEDLGLLVEAIRRDDVMLPLLRETLATNCKQCVGLVLDYVFESEHTTALTMVLNAAIPKLNLELIRLCQEYKGYVEPNMFDLGALIQHTVAVALASPAASPRRDTALECVHALAVLLEPRYAYLSRQRVSPHRPTTPPYVAPESPKASVAPKAPQAHEILSPATPWTPEATAVGDGPDGPDDQEAAPETEEAVSTRKRSTGNAPRKCVKKRTKRS
jgi:hypothetical protein